MLRIDHIAKRYREQQVLRGIDLNVEAGEFVSLLGPSGCGKTTLLRIVCGIDMPDEGRVLFQGDDITRWPAARRGFGVVFQSYALFPNLTAAQNVAFGLNGQPAAQARERVAEMLSLVGLGAQAQRYPAQLSGGQQQRVALARALAPRPRLLLLDEPLSALDAQVRTELRSEIRQLQRQLGIASIMVTHDQEEALSMADRVVLMHQGRIEQQGSPEQLYAQPVSQFAAGFVGRMNLLPATAEGADQVRIGEASLRCALAGFERGDALLVGVRPESVVLHPAQPTALPNLLRARVVETSFLGSMALVRLYSPTLQCQVDAQWPLRHDVGLPDWLQGEVLMELPAAALQPLAAPDARKAACARIPWTRPFPCRCRCRWTAPLAPAAARLQGPCVRRGAAQAGSAGGWAPWCWAHWPGCWPPSPCRWPACWAGVSGTTRAASRAWPSSSPMRACRAWRNRCSTACGCRP